MEGGAGRKITGAGTAAPDDGWWILLSERGHDTPVHSAGRRDAQGRIPAKVVERLNGVLKLTTRHAFGLRTAKCTENALFHVVGELAGRVLPGKLPTPDLAA